MATEGPLENLDRRLRRLEEKAQIFNEGLPPEPAPPAPAKKAAAKKATKAAKKR